MDGDNSVEELTLSAHTSTSTNLNDIKLLINLPIVYSMVSMIGEAHNPKFTWKAQCYDVIVYGVGFSKKKAKKNCAYNFFEKVKHDKLYDKLTINEYSLAKLPTNDKHYTEQLLNPISNLQEYCTRMYWESPKYSYKFMSFNVPSYYEATCYLKSYVFVGNGKTKKAAKQQAAQLMYREIISRRHMISGFISVY